MSFAPTITARGTGDPPRWWTRRQIADTVGVSIDVVRNWERGGYLHGATTTHFQSPTPAKYATSDVQIAGVLAGLTSAGCSLRHYQCGVGQLERLLGRGTAAHHTWAVFGFDGALEGTTSAPERLHDLVVNAPGAMVLALLHPD